MDTSSLTVNVISRNSGRLVASFSIEDEQQAVNISTTLMKSKAWAKCYVVCLDLYGTQRFIMSHCRPSSPPEAIQAKAAPELPYSAMDGEVSGVFKVIK